VNKKIFWKRQYFSLGSILLLFGIVYALISLVNHYFFRTSALDLGLYTNALYDYTHLQWNDSLTFKKIPENLLADHFDLYLIIFSPLSFVFGSYTLLLIQIASVLIGALGVYSYFVDTDRNIALAAMIAFLLFFGIYSALAFDYHSNVVATMLVPWLLLNVKKEKFKIGFALLIGIVIAKENMAIWMIFVCLGLIVEYRRKKKTIFILIAFILFSFTYYFITVHIAMPGLSNSGKYPHFHYSVLGENTFEAIGTLISEPIKSFNTLFTNHSNDSGGDFVKLELHIMVLISGGFMLFRKPAYIVMLIPIYVQKLFHDYITMWGITDQYAIEFAPILAIGSFSVVSEISNKKVKKYLSWALIICNLIVTIRVMDSTIVYTNKVRTRIYNSQHYQKNYDIRLVYEKLKLIPGDAPVSVQTNFLPHLALRDKVYQFPLIHDAEYIVLAPGEQTYPIKQEKYDLLVDGLFNSPKWGILFQSESITILKRRSF
jgi:uncharacterized membrane protein